MAIPRKSEYPTRHQRKLAAYLSEGFHLIFDADRKRRGLSPFRAKPITQVAVETGMTVTNARYWLRQDHYALWLRFWSGIKPEVWDKIEAERGCLVQPVPTPRTT
ncbi:hypothetical protein [Hyphomicrobium sp. D-2]|uniref:hypothetical protein n=1 Tax=Hyphomicrobium sp. D-2 TaxID=3041621 RepID=UPI0024550028|nr:hypothetical protein [Hyphomicrobium sp. D-2]MDH4982786.1 hypothetical protein [Hyphomicrobium sp. D-2]